MGADPKGRRGVNALYRFNGQLRGGRQRLGRANHALPWLLVAISGRRHKTRAGGGSRYDRILWIGETPSRRFCNFTIVGRVLRLKHGAREERETSRTTCHK
jgi:hypothetical protein